MKRVQSRCLRIGIDATALVARPTGVGNYIRRVLEPLCRAHVDAEFVLLSNEDIVFPPMPNVRHRISRPKRRGPWWQNTHLRAMLEDEQLDLFWATNGLLPLRLPARMASLATVHDFVYRFAPHTLPRLSYWGRRLAQPHAVRRADCVVAVSETTAADLLCFHGRLVDAVLPPLADPVFRRPPCVEAQAVARRLGLPERYLLTLGTQEPRKNLVALVDAYLDARRTGVQLPLLVLAGGKGWLDGELDHRLEQAQAQGYVRRLGYVDIKDLPSLYSACETFLMPSIYEGFGMPLLEAQLCGAPVVHGTHGSMREAAAGLGVETGVDRASLRASLERLARGELPVACRLPHDVNEEATATAQRLWDLMRQAMALRARMAAA